MTFVNCVIVDPVTGRRTPLDSRCRPIQGCDCGLCWYLRNSRLVKS